MIDPEKDTEKIAETLGASRVFPVTTRIGGPLDMLALRNEVYERLRSTGGRPSDPSWDFSRQVPFKAKSWKKLVKLAESVSTEERSLSPGQLAAILVERALAEL